MAEKDLNESLVDRLLAAAFEGAPAVAPPTPSDDVPTEISPRYRIEGVIGRGGVGIVLRARDVELGRSVALKVLRREHVGHEGLRRRFLEEAQIGGQLEHPGVVPVHEMGRAPDSRPFFAMKLIQGRTLGELLAQRRDVADDRVRFLGIFEQVCLTVAYAHARGVIHRDLKPANVMVGAFGEVQVADWGLAKVVGRAEPPIDEAPASDAAGKPPSSKVSSTAAVRPISTVRTSTTELLSQAGAVLGTLSYMAPEQARGEMANVDARADVFALGAILLELLTGKPPYTGDSGEQYDAARNGALAPALARLDAARGDPVVVALARRCLALAPADRPADASEVARALQEWRAGQEQRAHAAELAAATAQAKAAQERHARRLTLALAGTIVVALLGGGGAWLATERGERTRREAAARPLREELVRARELSRQAEAQPAHLVAPREAALAAGDAALAAARAADPGEELRREAAALHVELAAAAAASRAAAARREEEIAIAGELSNVIGRWWIAPWEELDATTESLFRRLGVDLATMSDAQIVARVRASYDPVEFCDHLLAWMKVRAELAGPKAAPRDFDRLLAIVQAADPDPWRVKLRGAVPAHLDVLEAAVTDPDLWRQEPRTISHLGSLLSSFGKKQLAIDLLRRAARLHPREFTFHWMLGLALTEEPFRGWEEAIEHAAVAVTMAPEMVGAQVLLGDVRDGLGDFDGAIAAYDEALRLDSRSRDAASSRAWSLLYAGRTDDSLSAIAAALPAHPADVSLLHGRATALLARGDVATARARLRELLASSGDLQEASSIALSLVLAGDPDGAATGLRDALNRVTPFVKLDVVGALHSVRSYALEEAGQLDEALAQLRRFQQLLLQRGVDPATLDLSGITRLEELIRLQELLPDLQGGALEPANPGESARVALLLARRGATVDAFEVWEELLDGEGAQREALAAEPGAFLHAARVAARLLDDVATPAALRERALDRFAVWIDREVGDAFSAQAKAVARPARTRIHTLLVDPALLVVRDPARRAALPEPEKKLLERLEVALRAAMHRTRP